MHTTSIYHPGGLGWTANNDFAIAVTYGVGKPFSLTSTGSLTSTSIGSLTSTGSLTGTSSAAWTSDAYSTSFTSEAWANVQNRTAIYRYTVDNITWLPLVRQQAGGASLTFAERLRQMLKKRSSSMVITGTKPPGRAANERESRARETLLAIVGEQKYQNFLRCGFVSVKAKSGRVYQIFPGHGKTRVFEKGKLIETLCIVLDGDFPPTDSVIIRYLLVLNNETLFWNKSIQWGSRQRLQAVVPDRRLLTDIAREVRAA